MTRLAEALMPHLLLAPILLPMLTGGLMLELLEVEGRPLPQGSGRGRGGAKGPMRKRATQSRLAEVKRAQKRRRKRG